MSAIAGMIRFDGAPVERAVLDRMTNLLEPYGRDAQRHWQGSSAALLHTLLRITPEDRFDHQPLVDATSGTVVVFDGRLDNRDEVSEALGIPGAGAALMADSELVQRACIAWDTEAPKRLLGDWCVACWRPEHRRLWLARDPCGARPLFWHEQPTFFAFSTLPKALFAIPGVPKAICEERLADRLLLLPTIGSESFYKDIQRVEPGQIVVVEGRKTSSHRYHCFDPERELRLPTDDDYLQAFREQLDRAVARRLRATGPIASHLSSGFDSSTVTAVAAQQLALRNQRLIAYTAVPREGFDGPVPKGRHADEGPGANALAARFTNIDHVLSRTNGVSPFDHLEQAIEARDRFPNNPCNRVWLDAIEVDAVARGANALLTAEMGNMTISYTGDQYLPALVGQGAWGAWAHEILALRRRCSTRRWLGFVVRSLSPYVPPPVWHTVQAVRGRSMALRGYSAIHPDFRKRMKHRIDQAQWDLSYRGWTDGRRARIAVLGRVDNAVGHAAANVRGLEIRDPTSDVRLTEFCLSVPDHQYLRDGRRRWLLMRIMGDVLPPEITKARTSGLQYADWYETATASLPRMREELARMAAHGDVGKYIDLDALNKLVDNWPKSGWDRHRQIHSHRIKLMRGMGVGTFVRYVEDTNA